MALLASLFFIDPLFARRENHQWLRVEGEGHDVPGGLQRPRDRAGRGGASTHPV